MHHDTIPTTSDLVRALLEAQHPKWSSLPIARFASTGTENAIYRIGHDLAARLPLRPTTPDRVLKIHRWLPMFAKDLPLQISEPVGMGVPGEGYPCHWSIHRWLEGQPATFERLGDPCAAAEALGGFIRALQAIDATGGPPPGAHNFSRGVPLADRDAQTRDAIERSRGLLDVHAATVAWEEALSAPPWRRPPVWVHGDLAPANMLANDGALAAIIDWGGLGVGDPATDMLPAWNMFRGESREAFRAASGVDDATWARGRGLALSVGLVALPYYLHSNPAMVAWARGMIAEALSSAPSNR